MKFAKAEFIISTLDKYPDLLDQRGKPLPEIALVGRSNVGKSSLINHLLHRKSLAKVSAKPGKTQTINFFKIDDDLILVDLPGYGYANRPKDLQLKWSNAIDHYLNHRKSLALVVLLIDSRRQPGEEDLAIIEWARHHRKPLLLIFTKSDTLSGEKQKVAGEYLYYSIKDPRSRQNLIGKIKHLVHGIHQ